MNIAIRNANDKDAEKIAELTNSSYSVAYQQGFLTTRANDTKEKILAELENGSKIFVAEINGQLIGTVRYEIKDDAVRLYKLAVAPEYRKQGIGNLLNQKAFDAAKELGYKKVRIEVHEEKGLIPYYEKSGFKIAERYKHKDHYEVIMEKELFY